MKFLALIILLAAGSREPVVGQELLDRTLALVGGQAITLSDARAAIALGLIAADRSADPIPGATARLVDRELILREVQRYAPPAPLESAVDARLTEIRSAIGDAAAVNQLLERHGFTESRLRAWVRDDLRTQAYLVQRFASASTVRDRNELIADWLEELRRRTDVVILQ